MGLSLLLRHNLLALLPVAFVADEDLVHAFGSVLLHVRVPGADVVEAALVGKVKDEEDAHGAAVVRGGDCPEALLAGRVPDLQLDLLAIELDGTYLEVDADSGDEGGRPCVVAEAEQEAGLADA